MNLNTTSLNANGNFANITVDFSQCLNYSGKSTIGADAGAVDGTTGKGRKLGAMTGIFIDTSGRIYGTYDNGNTELLGQIAVAQFSNASGLEKVGESCYRTTLNSGEFDGIGVEISADGSSMTTGELENVERRPFLRVYVHDHNTAWFPGKLPCYYNLRYIIRGTCKLKTII